MHTLLILSLLLLLGKATPYLFNKIKLPPLVGLIFLGIILGPTLLGVIEPPELTASSFKERVVSHYGNEKETVELSEMLPSQVTWEIIHFFSLIGVIILLFIAGLETDIRTFVRAGKTSSMVAFGGIVFPFILGFLVSLLFDPANINRALLVGTLLTATSVSVSVMSLMAHKKIQSKEGTTIITAAIIDDIIGIIILSIVLAAISGDKNGVLINILLMVVYLVGSVAFGWFLVPFFMNISKKMSEPKSVTAVALALMFLFAAAAELSHIAGITGAYLAGLFIGRTHLKKAVKENIEIIGHSLFVPLFFIFIGLQIDLKQGNYNWGFIILFVLVALVGKFVGSGLLARLSGFSMKSSFIIGAGMMPRGEVALVIASLGLRYSNIFDPGIIAATVLLIITSSFLTPILLERGFVGKEAKHA
ncbi:MAG: hypothetical protein GF401_01405 [Chitinivibrionales bacterium]|nr:hypothetical protein [Chitinivibrionales bacterium]